jgi:uric acid-xanthine permease
MSLGLASLLVPTWFSNFFHYSGSNKALQGLIDAVVIVVETSYAISVVVSVILHLIMPESKEKQEGILVEGSEILPIHNSSHGATYETEMGPVK